MKNKDFLCTLGTYGFSGKLIAEKTGFSVGYVYSLLKKHGIKLRDYRNGLNTVSKRTIVYCKGSLRSSNKKLRAG